MIREGTGLNWQCPESLLTMISSHSGDREPQTFMIYDNDLALLHTGLLTVVILLDSATEDRLEAGSKCASPNGSKCRGNGYQGCGLRSGRSRVKFASLLVCLTQTKSTHPIHWSQQVGKETHASAEQGKGDADKQKQRAAG